MLDKKCYLQSFWTLLFSSSLSPRYMWTLYQLACPLEPDSWPLYHVQASLHVFVFVCCTSSSVFLTVSTWHRAKFVVQLCHGELPIFFWILTEEYPPNPIGQVIWEWRGEFRQDFKGLCEPQKWRVKLSSIITVATARNFRRNRSTNVHDLQDVSSTEVLDRIRGGLCWP